MKIEKSNNPAAVGALVLVLVLIVGRILWMVFGHGGSAAAAATVSAGPPAPGAHIAAVPEAAPAAAAAPAPDASGETPAVAPTTKRNPFSVAVRPALRVSRLDDLPLHVALHRGATGAGVVPLTSLPPFPVRLEPGASVKRPQTSHGPVVPPTDGSAAQAEALLTLKLKALKLTATVGGTEPLAVVQTTDPEPVILHVGDSLDRMRVIAIHEQEVIFARGNGSWTLPLESAQSAADGNAADAASGTAPPATTPPATAPPVIPVATSEEKTDEQE